MLNSLVQHLRLTRLFPLALGCFISACSIGPGLTVDTQAMLKDEYFPGTEKDMQLDSPELLFQLPEQMKRQLDLQVRVEDSEYERYLRLREWAYRRFQDYEFTPLETVSLSEINSNRKINCLSFSALFVAAARYTDVDATFQLVFAPPYWDRENNSWINNQHINVTGRVDMPGVTPVTPNSDFPGDVPVQADTGPSLFSYRYLVDLNPVVRNLNVQSERISEQEVISLFYSNKSVESLVNEDLAAAYAYTKAALLSDEESALAWNNLGVLYNRVQQPQLAQLAFEQAIRLDANSYSARSNLARLHRNQGDDQQAIILERQIAEFRDANPYYHAAMAEEELAIGNLNRAKQLFEDAIDRKYSEHYFHHQLAIINQALGDREAMLENLRSARRYARGNERTRFSNKLAALENLL